MRLLATLALAAALPQHGVVVPGKSLGGLRLGATPAQVQAAWGSSFGLCLACSEPTWYFTYRPFEPQGVGVSFHARRADALFTLWSPPGWHTREGLRIGDPAARAHALYGPLTSVACGSYSVLVTAAGGVVTSIYLLGGKVWGFGLSRAGAPACR